MNSFLRSTALILGASSLIVNVEGGRFGRLSENANDYFDEIDGFFARQQAAAYKPKPPQTFKEAMRYLYFDDYVAPPMARRWGEMKAEQVKQMKAEQMKQMEAVKQMKKTKAEVEEVKQMKKMMEEMLNMKPEKVKAEEKPVREFGDIPWFTMNDERPAEEDSGAANNEPVEGDGDDGFQMPYVDASAEGSGSTLFVDDTPLGLDGDSSEDNHTMQLIEEDSNSTRSSSFFNESAGFGSCDAGATGRGGDCGAAAFEVDPLMEEQRQCNASSLNASSLIVDQPHLKTAAAPSVDARTCASYDASSV